jgi:hypothetical protein
MSEAQGLLFEPTFNKAVKVVNKDEALTSDAGVLLLREADHRLGLTASLGSQLHDTRQPHLRRYENVELLRERIYALAQGYRNQDDLDRLAHDPAMKAAVWDRPGDSVADERLASQPSQSRLIKRLTSQRSTLSKSLSDWILAHQRASGPDHRVRNGTLDIDGFPIVVHGQQEGAAYNGYYNETVYSPLAASFSPNGRFDHSRLGCGFVHALLRCGNAAPAHDACRFIPEAIERARTLAQHVDVRFDAAFTIGEVMDMLTDQKVKFVGRLRNNKRLNDLAAPHIYRPAHRPPNEGYEYVVDLGMHKVDTWKHPQRIILVVVDKPDPKSGLLQLFPHHFFLVTNWTEAQRSAEALLAHYRQRGTFEDRFGEFNQIMHTRLSHASFAANETELLLSLLAFNLINILRREMESGSGNGWDLGRLEKTVLKAGARLARGSRRLRFFVAAAVAPLWRILLRRMSRWTVPTLRTKAPQPKSRGYVPAPEHAFQQCVLRL